MEHSESLTAFLASQAEKIMKDPDGLEEAREIINQPAFHLNLLLEAELSFHRQVILKIVNRIGEEMPEEFQEEGIFVEFYFAALRNLQSSPRLAFFKVRTIDFFSC